MTACSFPGCPHPARVKGHCAGHYQQKRRQIEAWLAAGEQPETAAHMYRLRPLRGKHGQREREPLVRLSGLRVSPSCAKAVIRDPPGARNALERWSRK